MKTAMTKTAQNNTLPVTNASNERGHKEQEVNRMLITPKLTFFLSHCVQSEQDNGKPTTPKPNRNERSPRGSPQPIRTSRERRRRRGGRAGGCERCPSADPSSRGRGTRRQLTFRPSSPPRTRFRGPTPKLTNHLRVKALRSTRGRTACLSEALLGPGGTRPRPTHKPEAAAAASRAPAPSSPQHVGHSRASRHRRLWPQRDGFVF